MIQLPIHTLFVGQKLTYLSVCQSTNDIANQLSTQNQAIEGQVVWTSHQTKGRGQRGNTWEAQADQNLTFSLILMPTFLDASQQFRLHILTSLAILDSLKNFANFKIKWPNDIYFQDSKIGGILIENTLQATKIKNSVIGIGLNIHQTEFETSTATSLSKKKKKKYELPKLLATILENIEKRYLQLRAGDFENMKMSYLQEMYRYQENHLFKSDAEVFWGQIVGIDQNGKLAIHVDKNIRYFDFKEISFL